MEERERGGLDRLFEQSKQAKGTARRRTIERAGDTACSIEGIDDEGVCYALASITPLLGVQDECREQSLVYLVELFNVSGTASEDSWAGKSKKLPHASPLGEGEYCCLAH